MRAAALALACGLAGCATATPRIAELAPTPSAELAATPFFPDSGTLCGPAALATLLSASGVPTSPETLEPWLYVPGRAGTLQAEMVAAARRSGRVPYPVEGGLRELLTMVSAGYPVLVLQNLGISLWPAWHYAVVIGYDGAEDVLVLRSGTQARERVPRRSFLRRWRYAQQWAFVAASPANPPEPVEAVRWLQAASAFEQLAQPAIAETAYAAATRRWPERALGWQLLANAQHAQGKLRDSERSLREALRREESAASLNNLAQVLNDRGCSSAAAAVIRQAAQAARTPAEGEAIRSTAAALGQPARDAPGCPAAQPS